MKNTKKVPTLFLAILPILVMILFLGVGYALFKLPAEVLMLASAGVAGIIAYTLGYSWDDIMNSIVSKLSKAMPAIFILIIVGFMIGSWITGGTIPVMIYYGLKFINPSFLAVTAFIVTAFISICTGTSWGAAGTIGIALMGIAVGTNASLPMIAGAIVSGAYFGDKLSPLSDTTNLAPIAAGTDLYSHIRHMLYTTLPGAIICIIVFTVVGISSNVGDVLQPQKINDILSSLEGVFSLNLIVLLPPAIILWGSITKKPTIPIMLLSSAVAMICGIFIQGFDINSVFSSTVSGFKLSMLDMDTNTLAPEIQKLLERGGMLSMLGTVIIAFCAYAFAGTLAVTGSLDIVLNRLTRNVKTTGGIILATITSCITAVFVTSNGQLSILVPGEMFRDTYIKMGLDPKNLSRTLEDSATVVEPIVPWTAAGVYMATTLGVPTLSYLPWAILCYTGVIFAIIYGFTGFGIAKIDKKSKYYDEYLALNNLDEKI